jgi:ADP-ribosylglycohydrolase
VSAIAMPPSVSVAIQNRAVMLYVLKCSAMGGSTVAGLDDTTCAIVGGIVVMYAGVEGVPRKWLISREPIPPHMLKQYPPLV